jgi:RNA polymerase sigma-70 factor, ECF subfamily
MESIEGCSLGLAFREDARAEVDVADLVGAYSTLLFRVAHAVLRSRAEAEDVVQDVFVRVLEHRKSLEAVREMRAWLIRIAWNLAIDRRRRIRPEQMDESFVGSLVARTVPADEALDEAQRMNSVLQELERLPKGERRDNE